MLGALLTEGLERAIAHRSVAMLQPAIELVEAVEQAGQTTLAEVRLSHDPPTALHQDLKHSTVYSQQHHQQLPPKTSGTQHPRPKHQPRPPPTAQSPTILRFTK